MNIGLCKIFKFVTNKLNALSVGAVYKHHVGFDATAISSVNAVDKIANNGSFATSGRTVEDNVGDFADLDEIVEFSGHKIVFVKNGCNLIAIIQGLFLFGLFSIVFRGNRRFP